MSRQSLIGGIVPPCLAILLGLAVLGSATDGFRAVTEEGARRLRAAQDRPPVPTLFLEDMNGKPLRLGHEPGAASKVTLVEFIYTTCPTICQAAGDRFAELRDRVRQAALGGSLRLISVSFDPERDAPPQMRRYAEIHQADGAIWTIARARPDDLAVLAQSFGLRVIPDGWGGYEHNAAIHLVDQRGRLSAIFDIDDVEAAFQTARGRL